jgi:carbamoylphosphate synthase small subunit
VVGEVCEEPSHWNMAKTLSTWMEEQNIPGIHGIDTRQLTKHMRKKGTMLGKIIVHDIEKRDAPGGSGASDCNNGSSDLPFKDPNLINLVNQVSIKVYNLSLPL